VVRIAINLTARLQLKRRLTKIVTPLDSDEYLPKQALNQSRQLIEKRFGVL